MTVNYLFLFILLMAATLRTRDIIVIPNTEKKQKFKLLYFKILLLHCINIKFILLIL